MARSTPAGAARTRRPRQQPDPLPAPVGPPVVDRRQRPNDRLITDLCAIVLVVLACLLGLALARAGSVGPIGYLAVGLVRFFYGHLVYLAPFCLAGMALALIFDLRRNAEIQLFCGLVGFKILALGAVHLLGRSPGGLFDSTVARASAFLGRTHDPALVVSPDGGLLGAVVVWSLSPFGRWGSVVILGAIGVASLLLITDLTLRTVIERAHERSVFAGEKLRAQAESARTRAREVAAALPARREPERKKPVFLEVGNSAELPVPVEKTPAAEPAAASIERPRPRTFRRKGSEPPVEVADPAPGILAALNGPEAPTAPPDAGLPSADALAAANRTVAAPEPSAAPELELTPPPVPAELVRTTPRARRGTAGRAPVGDGEFVLPPVSLLQAPVVRPKKMAQETEANIAILENTLAQFRIQAQVVEIADGPSVTRYEIRLGEGIRVKKILDLADNIAMSLSAMSVRVEAPIPGKAAIGIEVPKRQAAMVTMRECLESAEFQDQKSPVAFVLGKDISGEVRCADLTRMPHLLVAGATNSGKSVCLNVLIASLLYRARPDELKLIMIDPKRVELTLFEGIPHLVHPVVKDVKQAAGILRWVLKEMDRRFDLFSQAMARNIESYNQKVAGDKSKKLPFLVVVIDELADLMMQQGPEVEQAICRLAQLARATGIHLVIATQRPSVDVITGLIKANVPSRISFAVTSQIDSRTILDSKGAENLIGRGDMLFKPVDANKPMRIQGAFLHESEVEAIVAHLKTQGRPEYVAEAITVDHGAYGLASQEEADDELFEPAARFVVTSGHASTSMIQRRFKIGYTRAARLVDMMEARGIVGALDGAKPRDIMMSRDAVDEMFLTTRDSLFRGDIADRRAAAAVALEDDELDDEGGDDDGDQLVEIEETIQRLPSSQDPFVDD